MPISLGHSVSLFLRRAPALLCALLVTVTWSVAVLAETNWPERIDDPRLTNAFKLHERVISGGQPDGESAFAALREMGVKTIISVDGAKPDVDLAGKYGLRYVHLPHGYDGVPDDRAMELAKAVRDLPGPIFIHCHHGHHRSPAAASVACVGAGLIEPDQALAVLVTAGTSENYRGLYQSAQDARRFEDAKLDKLQPEFPAVAKVPPIADAMVEMEHTLDHLKLLASGGWKPIKAQPDLEPAHEALLLREHYTELARTHEIQSRPEDFRRLLADGEAAALKLESLLRDSSLPRQQKRLHEINQVFTAVSHSCTVCHQKYRDVPLNEKR